MYLEAKEVELPLGRALLTLFSYKRISQKGYSLKKSQILGTFYPLIHTLDPSPPKNTITNNLTEIVI